MSDTLSYICLFVLFYAAVLRLREMHISKKHQLLLAKKGFKRVDDSWSYFGMLSLHISFFIAVPYEIFFLQPIQNVPLQFFALSGFLFSQFVRYSALRALGEFWNTNIMAAKDNRLFVDTGPYKYIRHPNYLAVILEFLFIPLIGGCIFTSVIYTFLNAVVLYKRIKKEEAHLFCIDGYAATMQNKKRFIPNII